MSCCLCSSLLFRAGVVSIFAFPFGSNLFLIVALRWSRSFPLSAFSYSDLVVCQYTMLRSHRLFG